MVNIERIAAAALLWGVVLFAAGCGQSSGTSTAKRSAESDLFRLAHMNGCIECHNISAATIGPSWQAIADRYQEVPLADARALLIERVKKGSKGNWITWKSADGMPPLEKRVSNEHIEKLVDFILTLRKVPPKTE